MRTFELHRDEDATGVSGTGVVAEGVEFGDGSCVLHWLGELASTVLHKSIDDLIAIHGHQGRTRVVYGLPQRATDIGTLR